MDYRMENDSLGDVKVSNKHLWGAQTQRSLQNFKIGEENIPMDVIYSIVKIKKACAIVNHYLKKLTSEKSTLICQACDEILTRNYDSEFPLRIWQTGSATHTNTNRKN